MHKKQTLLRITIALGLVVVLLIAMTSVVGATRNRLELLSNTQNGYNLGTDPDVGWVSYRLPTPGDPTHIMINVKIHKGIPNSGPLDIELVTKGTDTGGGLPPDGSAGHTGYINIIGTISTNGAGEGQSGDIMVDVTTLGSVAPSGQVTYAHVDIEDNTFPYVIGNNNYAATLLSWTQP